MIAKMLFGVGNHNGGSGDPKVAVNAKVAGSPSEAPTPKSPHPSFAASSDRLKVLSPSSICMDLMSWKWQTLFPKVHALNPGT